MIEPRPRSRRSMWWRGLAVAMVGLAILVGAWDWNWLRPSIQHFIFERSARRVDFDTMHIGLDGSGAPVVSFRGLRIENAPWAESRPLIAASEASFTFVWRSFFEEIVVIKRVRLVGAQVDLERQADGLRNWRLTRPDDRGPMRVTLLSLDAQDSSVRILHRGLGLEMTAHASTLLQPEVLAGYAGGSLPNLVTFEGALRGVDFEGQTAASRVLTFFDTHETFGVRGHARVAGVEVAAEGLVADLATLGRLSLELRASAGEGARLWSQLPAGLAAPPGGVTASTQLEKNGPAWTFAKLRVGSNGNDLSGRVEVDRPAVRQGRTLVRAQLTSTRLNLADFLPVPSRRAGAAPAMPSARSSLDLTALRSIDAEIGLRVGALAAAPVGPWSELSLDASLASGVLTLQRFQSLVAGGRVQASGRLDASGSEPRIELNASAHGLQLERIASVLAKSRQLSGELDAQLRWTVQGSSWFALTRQGTGSMVLALRNASIAPALDAKLALDAGGVVAAWSRGDDRVPVRCGDVRVDFAGGKGTTRQMSFDTARATIAGRGSVDLSAQTFAFVLTPYRHRSTLLTLHRSMQVAGTFDSARIALVDVDESRPLTTCAGPAG